MVKQVGSPSPVPTPDTAKRPGSNSGKVLKGGRGGK